MKYTPEARAVPREHASLPARITSNNGFTVIHCEIRDFSTAGANLILSDKEFLPEEFDLEIPLKETSYRVALVWRTVDSCGVKFLRKLQYGASRHQAFV